MTESLVTSWCFPQEQTMAKSSLKRNKHTVWLVNIPMPQDQRWWSTRRPSSWPWLSAKSVPLHFPSHHLGGFFVLPKSSWSYFSHQRGSYTYTANKIWDVFMFQNMRDFKNTSEILCASDISIMLSYMTYAYSTRIIYKPFDGNLLCKLCTKPGVICSRQKAGCTGPVQLGCCSTSTTRASVVVSFLCLWLWLGQWIDPQ